MHRYIYVKNNSYTNMDCIKLVYFIKKINYVNTANTTR